MPGARYSGCSWVDASGSYYWLFGGYGFDKGSLSAGKFFFFFLSNKGATTESLAKKKRIPK
jgi:hypothetical protein